MSIGKSPSRSKRLKIGYIHGEPSRLNEKIVDGQWIGYVSEYAELVKIPPLALMKLFGGSIQQWHECLPDSLDRFAAGLKRLCETYGITLLYLNLPLLVPYVLWARNRMNIDLTVVFFAHSVALEFWLKLWLAAAPAIRSSDVLLCPSRSCKTAMTNISARYQSASCLPHCIKLVERRAMAKKKPAGRILSIGRIEDAKNIDFLLRCFADVRAEHRNARLTIAGEYTGAHQDQIQEYKRRIDDLVRSLRLGSSVDFTGPVFGAAKDLRFEEADLLVNLSTDPGETFGYNLIEAKTWGLPTVCTRWDGFREVVDHLTDGVFVDCRWDGATVEIDDRQTVAACLRLLSDDPFREKLGRGALHNSAQFDYRSTVPDVINLMAKAHSAPRPLNDESAETAMIPIRELPEIYDQEKLRELELHAETPLSILLKEYQEPLMSWMPRVKPIIGHFASQEHVNVD
ncbi:MAG: glycosyltransferase family 4 protein [Spirochaetales bacterium]|nr:glycosyltransferase family 4 protein [Spirochaetales bacterium]